MEAADCLLCLLQHAHENKYDLFNTARVKHEINERRKWGPPDEYGVIEHIKSEEQLYNVIETRPTGEKIKLSFTVTKGGQKYQTMEVPYQDAEKGVAYKEAYESNYLNEYTIVPVKEVDE